MLEAVFLGMSVKVGTYTSPHILHYGERIRINGIPANDSQLVRAFEAVEYARQDIPLTYFEFGTLAALYLFKNAHIAVAILEVGMGGRLDAVNVETPDVVLLTKIDIDHEPWLGVGREKIGSEKAALFRLNGQAVINDPDPPDSVIETAHQLGCQTALLGVDYVVNNEGSRWDWMPKAGSSRNFLPEMGLPQPNLSGDHQLQNAAGIIAVLQVLRPHLSISRGALEDCLMKANVCGRLQIIPGTVEIIVDVGHNVNAVGALAKYIVQNPVTGKTFAIFSLLKDKDIVSIVTILKQEIDRWYLTELDEDRGMTQAQLEIGMSKCGVKSMTLCDSPRDALMQSQTDAKPGDRILICGSTYLASAILPLVQHDIPRA